MISLSYPAQKTESVPVRLHERDSQCQFGVIGLSYRTAPLDLRGRMSFDRDGARAFLAEVRQHWVEECMVLSTCNRTEIYYTSASERAIIGLLASRAGVSAADLQPHLYLKRGLEAASHLFRVASGLDSAVLGETEIVAQIKQAWQIANDEHMAGAGLGLTLQRSMVVSKRVRTETDLCRGVTSTASLAIQTAARRLGSLSGKRVLVLGAGQIAERLVKELHVLQPAGFQVLSRTQASAQRLADLYGAEAGSLEGLTDALEGADVVFSALTSPEPVITDRTLPSSGSLFIVDLGVPANVQITEPRAGVESVHIDSLSAECELNGLRRAGAVPAALDILEAELTRLNTDLVSRSASPTIKALVDQAEGIRSQNLDWAMSRLDDLDPRQRKVVEDLSIRIIKGLLQAPIEGLKGELATRDHRQVITRLFQLEEKSDRLAG